MMDGSKEIEEADAFVVKEEEANLRIDKILADHYRDLRSRSYFQYLISNGYVQVNGRPIKKNYKPAVGELVEIEFVLSKELDLTPENIPLEILYEDQYLIAINKPAGLVVHPAPGHWSGTFVNGLLYHCKLTSEDFGSPQVRPGIVHRLDKDTSGILIAAKDAVTQERLSLQFSQRTVAKEYIAVCCGNPGEGEISAPIGRHPVKRKLMAIREVGGREAVTRFKTLATDGKISIVKVNLITGRTHQIRVHMQHRGTPILGDESYGNSERNKHYRVQRQLLHAWRLTLKHPYNQQQLDLIAPIPADIKVYMDKFQMDRSFG